jgi:hypothetical protein
MMARIDLFQHGYTVKEVDVACILFTQLMTAARVTAQINDINGGRLLACTFAVVKAVDSSADQATAKTGHLFRRAGWQIGLAREHPSGHFHHAAEPKAMPLIPFNLRAPSQERMGMVGSNFRIRSETGGCAALRKHDHGARTGEERDPIRIPHAPG